MADSALYSADNLAQRAQTTMKWISRVPATVTEAHMVLAQAPPEHMAPRSEGYRYQECSSTYGGVAQRWMLVYSEPRQDQAQRTVNKQWLKHSEQESQAWKKLCRQSFACDADARQALEACAHG